MLSGAQFADMLSRQQFAFQRGAVIFRVLKDFSRLVAGVQSLARSISEMVELQSMQGPASDRLDALEMSRARFEAEMEALLMSSDNKLKAAKNAEQRERHQRKAYEEQLDPFDPDSQEGIQEGRLELPLPHDPPGQAEGLQPLPVGLETNDKKHALNAKFR